MGEGTARNRACPCGSGLKYKNCCLRKRPFPQKPQNLPEEDRDKFAAIIDNVTDQYLANHLIIFSSDQERHQARFRSVRAMRKDWERSHVCRYPGCSRLSVRRSHTIPRAALCLIAEDGHLLRPQFNDATGHLEMARIGVNNASTFAGFCEQHELEFQRFEAIVQMRDPTDVVLQLFRTVCSEIAIMEHEVRYLTWGVEDCRKRLDAWGRERLEESIKKSFRVAEDFHIDKFTIKEGGLLPQLGKKRDARARDLERFTNAFFKPFLDAQVTHRLSIHVIHDTLSERLPLALAGRVDFFYAPRPDVSDQHEVLAIANVVPSRAGTDIFISVPPDAGDPLMAYLSTYWRHDDREGLLQTIERWMLHNTDHWFLAPSVWMALPETHRSEALKQIMSTSDEIAGQPPVPLLDPIRHNPRTV